MKKLKYIVLWFIAIAVYSGFWLWFFNPQAPLSEVEIKQHLNAYATLYEKGRDSKTQIRLRGFLASDDGKEVYTLHLVRMRADPQKLPAIRTELLSVFDLLTHWSAPVLTQLYLRAAYPMMLAPVVSENLNRWGVEEDKAWTHFVLMRHRSRRDLMEVVNDKNIAAKQNILPATIESQFMLVAAPSTILLMFQPAMIIAWIILALGAIAHIAILTQDRKLVPPT